MIEETAAMNMTTLSVPIVKEAGEDEHEKERAARERRCKGPNHREEDAGEQLPKAEATRYRSCVARIAYLALDRWDLMFCARVLSR